MDKTYIFNFLSDSFWQFKSLITTAVILNKFQKQFLQNKTPNNTNFISHFLFIFSRRLSFSPIVLLFSSHLAYHNMYHNVFLQNANYFSNLNGVFTEAKCKGTTMLNMQFISCHCVYDYRVSHITSRVVNDM